MSKIPLTIAEIEERLETSLDPTQSSPPLAAPLAQALAPLARGEQELVLRWTDIIARTNTDMAYLFAAQAPEGLRRLRPADIEAWVVRAMDVYDKIGLYPACTVFRDVAAFAVEAHAATRGIAFEDVAGVLGPFVRGLSGRALKLESAEDLHRHGEPVPAGAARALSRPRPQLPPVQGDGRLPVGTGTLRQLPCRPDRGVAALPRPGARPRTCSRRLKPSASMPDWRATSPACSAKWPRCARRSMNRSGPPAWEGKIGRLRRPEATAEDSYALLAECYDGELPGAGLLPGHDAAGTRRGSDRGAHRTREGGIPHGAGADAGRQDRRRAGSRRARTSSPGASV